MLYEVITRFATQSLEGTLMNTIRNLLLGTLLASGTAFAADVTVRNNFV